MKNRIPYAIFFLFLSQLLVLGCKKGWLDVKSDKKLAVPSTLNDFRAMLDYSNHSGYGGSFGLSETAADGHYSSDAAFINFSNEAKNAYTWSNDIPYRNTNSYRLTYIHILSFNVVLDGLEKLKGDQSAVAELKASALFSRAWMFFNLAQLFAKGYDNKTADSDLGIPLRLDVDISVPSKRSTVRETYTQIIDDLLAAKDHLPVNPEFLARPSKAAAYALLARVYLTMQDYDNALLYSNLTLQMKSSLLDYNTIPIDNTFIGLNPEVLYATFLSPTSDLTTYCFIDNTLVELYDDKDLRKKVFFRGTSNAYRFKGTYGNMENHIFSGLATDEVYLIRAECYARKGNVGLAMKDLNDLLATRWVKENGKSTHIDQSAVDETDALNKILLERRKQLILRNIRWSDLQRLNMDNRFKKTISRTVNGTDYTLEPGSFRYTFPIPMDVIEQSGMKQNSGWE